jgi:hypothetical protein
LMPVEMYRSPAIATKPSRAECFNGHQSDVR